MSIDIGNLFTLLIGVLMIPVVGKVDKTATMMRCRIRIFSPRLLYPDGLGGDLEGLSRNHTRGAGFYTLPCSLIGRFL